MTDEYVGLGELCSVLRSKNAKCFLITLDMIFKDKSAYDVIRNKNLITKELIAEKYNVSVEDIPVFEYFDEAHAIKATLKRQVPNGSPGDRDTAGMNQEAPLLYINFPRNLFKE